LAWKLHVLSDHVVGTERVLLVRRPPVFSFPKVFGSVAVIVTAIGLAASSNAGVIAHYSFDSSVVADTSGNGNTLTIANGGPNLVGGQFGSAANFNGSSFLYLNGSASNASFNLATGNFALSFWYQSNHTSFGQFVGKNSSNLNQGYASTFGATYIGGDLNDTSAGGVGMARPANDSNTFQHVVFQKTGSLLQLYVNGSIVGASTTSGGVDAINNAFAIGARNISFAGGENHNGASQKMTGRIDEVWVFDRALISDEISNLNEFNSIDGQQVPEPGTIALFGLGLIGLRFGMRRKRQN
jgi:hypothetical protein